MDYRNYCDREVIQLKDDFMKKEIMFEDLINKVFEIGFEFGKKYAIKNAEKTIGKYEVIGVMNVNDLR